MPFATTQGKPTAIEALAERRKKFSNKEPINNDTLRAGSPMYFDCLGCNGWITVPENYVTRPKLCGECQAMKDLGWLE